MNRLHATAVIVACALAIASAWIWSTKHVDQLRRRESAITALANDAGSVLALRVLRERASLNERPRQDLIARVNESMTTAGLAKGSLLGVTTEADGPLLSSSARTTGDSNLEFRTQAMRVAFKGVKPGQLGEFLEDWRLRQPLWTTTALELSRAASKDADQERFDATIVLSVIYATDAEPGELP